MQPKKTRRTGIPKFLRYLYDILSNENAEIITWIENGSAFIIKNVPQFEVEILPKYYKHNKLSSFQRQLNYFNFRKWTKTESSGCTFSHPCFTQNHPENLKLISKKSHPNTLATISSGEPFKTSSKRPASYLTEVHSKTPICKRIKLLKPTIEVSSSFPNDLYNTCSRIVPLGSWCGHDSEAIFNGKNAEYCIGNVDNTISYDFDKVSTGFRHNDPSDMDFIDWDAINDCLSGLEVAISS